MRRPPRWPLKLRVGPGTASARALRVKLARITDDDDEGPPFGGQRHQPRLTPGGYCTQAWGVAQGVAPGVAPARPKTANEAERRFQAVVPSTIVGDENT